MDTNDSLEEAVAILQQLGLKEYEAKCFVGLTRLSTGTAKELGEITEVPRTRVYDAIRVLEAQGLVEVQHSSPQRFRAVSLEEATATLHDQYEDRITQLRESLSSLDPVDADDSTVQEVWAMSGTEAIENRVETLIEDATEEIVLVIGEERLLTDELLDSLRAVGGSVDLIVGTTSDSVEQRILEVVPDATTFISGLEWLHEQDSDRDEVAVGRLLMTDRSAILVSSVVPRTGKEQAIFGTGFGNGLVVVSRRLISQGLLQREDPGKGST
jgi:sugar-specific transcriptional regulator TrmB